MEGPNPKYLPDLALHPTFPHCCICSNQHLETLETFHPRPANTSNNPFPAGMSYHESIGHTGMTQAYGSRMLPGVITQPGPSQTAVASPVAEQDCSSCTSNMDNTLSASVAVLSSLIHPVQAGAALLPTARTSCRGVLLPRDVATVPAHSQGNATSCCSVAPLLQQPWARGRCTVQGPSSRAVLICCPMHCWVSTGGPARPGHAVLLALGADVGAHMLRRQ